MNKFDLEERTAKFGVNIIRFCKTASITVITKPIINQLIRSSTGIGANYMEANGADSKKDFRNKISICKKEAKETMHWLRMIAEADPNLVDKSRLLWKEAHELSLIFGAINKKLF
ncbi:four helix bundle protein [Candidatus Gottesmanbacteria bacterium RIFCSPLOWO2_02_FULL_40_10]|uniref:Four helix bundle protein n=1 Tax=Candidatus Gottesmanbacteria bacterium RIFCSPHIGHO2_01_FULL_40_15 TaxID=1798376 RepID=A0A1F5YZS7_9BACT|nr:MAG: four helix bundle protein [Candidatus Gottesmanbacteria bacterium RIFCSPHIGHO2_01_FULL_40_15]OGG33783.1 MAG: four helix bundle protein [Candidatus Gottesmanbacteria bacterium RIFCSPLOWO2_02_FULL_40_10]